MIIFPKAQVFKYLTLPQKAYKVCKLMVILYLKHSMKTIQHPLEYIFLIKTIIQLLDKNLIMVLDMKLILKLMVNNVKFIMELNVWIFI